jgi:hypothetical protein
MKEKFNIPINKITSGDGCVNNNYKGKEKRNLMLMKCSLSHVSNKRFQKIK